MALSVAGGRTSEFAPTMAVAFRQQIWASLEIPQPSVVTVLQAAIMVAPRSYLFSDPRRHSV